MEINESRTVLKTEDNSYSFDVFIDARGQRPLKVKDIPFPGLREQLQKTGDEIPNVGEDYTLQQPEDIRGRVAFGALPWLMHDQPFVQGITACAEIGEAMARAFNGDGEANSFAVMICQCGASPWPENN